MNQMQQSVIKTLAYFDMFSYPLTPEEVFFWLWKPEIGKRDDVCTVLRDMIARDDAQIAYDRGYYHLKHGKASADARTKKIWHTERRLKTVRRASKIVGAIPFVRAVFVCNQMPVTVKKSSDIDVFIIVENRWLWFTRLLITFVLSLMGMRRHGGKIENHVCLSFYATPEALDFSKISLDEPDIYMIYWIALLVPVYDPDNYFSIMQEKNTWIHKYIPHALQKYSAPRLVVGHGRVMTYWKKGVEYLLKMIGHFWMEKMAKKLQRAKMAKTEKNRNSDAATNVIITDSMLKFHENDRRREYREEWRRKIDDLL